MKSIFMLWAVSCHTIFEIFPNVYLRDGIDDISDKIVNALWPLDPNNTGMYGLNLQNFTEGIYCNAILQSVVMCFEIFLISIIISKSKVYLAGCSSSKFNILNRFKIKEQLGKYVWISIIAFILVQVLKFINHQLSR
jgi:hypothetical protein